MGERESGTLDAQKSEPMPPPEPPPVMPVTWFCESALARVSVTTSSVSTRHEVRAHLDHELHHGLRAGEGGGSTAVGESAEPLGEEERLCGGRRTCAAELTTSCLLPFDAPPFWLKSLVASLMAARDSRHSQRPDPRLERTLREGGGRGRTHRDELALHAAATALLLLAARARREALERLHGGRGAHRVGAHVALARRVGLLVRLLDVLLVDVAVVVAAVEERNCRGTRCDVSSRTSRRARKRKRTHERRQRDPGPRSTRSTPAAPSGPG